MNNIRNCTRRLFVSITVAGLLICWLFTADVCATVRSCLYCRDCTNATRLNVQQCNSLTGQNLCYVGVLSNGRISQGCTSSEDDLKIFQSSYTCTRDNCNIGSLSCLNCVDCDEPTMSDKIDCLPTENLCFAGVRQSNSKFNQGCSTNGQNKNPYSAFGTCETDNCNNFTNVCNLCSRCNEPTTIKQIVCTSKDSKCYAGLTSDGKYDQGCRAGNYLLSGYEAYIECSAVLCNNAKLICYYCHGCEVPTNSTQIICEYPFHDVCYLKRREDGKYDQGCKNSDEYFRLYQIETKLREDDFYCDRTRCNMINVTKQQVLGASLPEIPNFQPSTFKFQNTIIYFFVYLFLKLIVY